MSLFERIRANIRAGMVMYTPVKKKDFRVEAVENDKVVFRVGEKGNHIKVPRHCWDGIPNFLRGKGWVEIGSKHEVAEKGTFEEYLDGCDSKRHASWASYVVPMLEKLGIVEVDHCIPSRVKLK